MAGFRAPFFAVLAIAGCFAGPVLSDTNTNFTFKRVTVKERAVGGLIDVQITPEEDYYKNQKPTVPHSVEDLEPAVVLPETASNQSEWFWDHISASLDDAASGRLHKAMGHLQKDPGRMALLSPDLAHFNKLANEYGTQILLATLGKDVSPALVLAVIGVESSGRTTAVSSAGAVGLMQLIPETAKRFDVTDSTDPQQNINGGAAYLDWLLNEFNRDPLLALAGYNAGENAVKKHGGVPPYSETRAYVPKVVAAWQVARALCMSPPKYVTDGCVFKPQGQE